MRKAIYGALSALLAVTLFTACSDERGTEPGNDPEAVATLYVYNAELPNDPDCDALARVATNSATTEVYMLTETDADYQAHSAGGAEAYKEYVVSNGKKVEGAEKGNIVDVVVPGLKGKYHITVVARGGVCGENMATQEFTGQIWNDICTGTYHFMDKAQSLSGMASTAAMLQQSGDDATMYRIKNVFGPAQHLVFYKNGEQNADGEDVVRVDPQSTPFTFSSYGAVSISDMCSYQGEDPGWLNNAMDATGYCYFYVIYYVKAGYLAYGYDEFVPD